MCSKVSQIAHLFLASIPFAAFGFAALLDVVRVA
jgi:hypothetical protein